jgi:hypothetical protein
MAFKEKKAAAVKARAAPALSGTAVILNNKQPAPPGAGTTSIRPKYDGSAHGRAPPNRQPTYRGNAGRSGIRRRSSGKVNPTLPSLLARTITYGVHR